MLTVEGLLASVSEDEKGYRKATIIANRDGKIHELDVDKKRGPNGELDEAVDSRVRLLLSHGVFWNETPQGRRPSTVVKVIGVEPLAA